MRDSIVGRFSVRTDAGQIRELVKIQPYIETTAMSDTRRQRTAGLPRYETSDRRGVNLLPDGKFKTVSTNEVAMRI